MAAYLRHVHVHVLFVMFLVIIVNAQSRNANNSSPSFVIDYEQNEFLKDGKPFRYIAGAMHYFRVPRVCWKDRMLKFKAAGLNAIQTYIAWNMHEPHEEIFDFTGNVDIVEYLKMAKELGFVVIIRSGPYMDAERDMGGLPYWLLTANQSMVLRSSDPSYLKYVDRWVSVLLPKIEPLLYENGGPIISVQVENEYGSYFACDFNYMHHLRDLYRKYLGNTVVLFTTDGAADGFLKCGKVEGLYSTVDFGSGSNVSESFAAQRRHEPNGPFVNSEFYPGWIDHWGEKHSEVSSASVVKTLHDILLMNASVTIYMFEGGTSFGFTNGANLGALFQPNPTSYDFDAPLSEAGDPTEKYMKIRDVISNITKQPQPPIPPATPKYAYGSVKLEKVKNLFDALTLLSPDGPSRNKYPQSFEQLRQDYGFVLYRTNITSEKSRGSILSCSGIHDRGYVFLNKKAIGILDRETKIYMLFLELSQGMNSIDILVENQGRICYGSYINDTKGLITNVTIGSVIQTNWEMYTLSLNNTHVLDEEFEKPNEFTDMQTNDFKKQDSHKSDILTHIRSSFGFMERGNHIRHSTLSTVDQSIPAFYRGYFVLPTSFSSPRDTFLNMNTGWFHGVAFINGFNLGRYWPVRGPQVTLFVPASILKLAPAKNLLLLFELEFSPCGDTFSSNNCSVNFTSQPIINGTAATLIY